MKKLLGMAVLTSAMIVSLAFGALSMGWSYENGNWVYYDSNGYRVTNEWKTDSAGYYYYLDSNGIMAVNSFIDYERYVDSDGKMVTSAWRQIDGLWYYFDASGKLTQNKRRQIDGLYYYFGDEGYMLTGWINDGDDWYFADTSDGHLYTDCWKRLEESEDMPEIDDDKITVQDDGTYWFYFQSTGKLAHATDGDYKEYTINGSRYCFDEAGRMQTGWVRLSDESPIIAGYKYYNDSESLGTYGAAHTGWLSAYPPEDEEASLGSDVVWYYFDSKGVPYYGEDVSSGEDDETLYAKLRRIQKNGKTYTYVFNELGNPVYGLRKVQKSDGTVTSMYFGTKQESCLQYGETSITEADGTVSKFHFQSNGYGTNGVYNNKLYYMGKLQKAEDDSHAYFTVDGTTYLVNKSGTLVKNYNSKKDSDEVEYKSDSSGKRDGGTAEVSELVEPEFDVTEIG